MMRYHDHTKGHTNPIRLLCEAYSLCLGLAEGKAHSFYSFNKAKIWSKIFPVGESYSCFEKIFECGKKMNEHFKIIQPSSLLSRPPLLNLNRDSTFLREQTASKTLALITALQMGTNRCCQLSMSLIHLMNQDLSRICYFSSKS